MSISVFYVIRTSSLNPISNVWTIFSKFTNISKGICDLSSLVSYT